MEGDRGAGLHRARRLRRGPGQPHRLGAARVRDGRDRGEVPLLRDDRHASGRSPRRWYASTQGEQTLVIGQYIDQLDELGEHLDAPVIKGETSNAQREKLFEAFREGEISVLVVSKVANFSIDLPEATVAIQVSGTFGSRQEEAQRLGRVLRPKADGHEARFYSVVARDTIDQDFAAHRQRFLAEQGYAYRIVDADELLAEN